jgi:hypothetical protein
LLTAWSDKVSVAITIRRPGMRARSCFTASRTPSITPSAAAFAVPKSLIPSSQITVATSGSAITSRSSGALVEPVQGGQKRQIWCRFAVGRRRGLRMGSGGALCPSQIRSLQPKFISCDHIERYPRPFGQCAAKFVAPSEAFESDAAERLCRLRLITSGWLAYSAAFGVATNSRSIASRIRYFCILPVTVIGNSWTKRT